MEDDRKVLIVDENDLMRAIIGRILSARGYRCDHARTGAEATEYIADNGYDLVVTDLKLPVVSGYELIGRVRESAKNQRTPILVLSSLEGEPEAFLYTYRVQGYLAKPFTHEDFRWAVGVTLGEPGGLPAQQGEPGPGRQEAPGSMLRFLAEPTFVPRTEPPAADGAHAEAE